ncbi:MAG: STAS domain-containing protein [Oscillospiraceae bacterium]
MKIDSYTQGDICVITFIGKLDYSSSEALSEKLMEIINKSKNIVIDMTKCTYVSSSGLRLLLVSGKRVKQLGNLIVLANLSEEVRDIMEMTGFGTIFKCCDTLYDALGYLDNNTTLERL